MMTPTSNGSAKPFNKDKLLIKGEPTAPEQGKNYSTQRMIRGTRLRNTESRGMHRCYWTLNKWLNDIQVFDCVCACVCVHVGGWSESQKGMAMRTYNRLLVFFDILGNLGKKSLRYLMWLWIGTTTLFLLPSISYTNSYVAWKTNWWSIATTNTYIENDYGMSIVRKRKESKASRKLNTVPLYVMPSPNTMKDQLG